jgi:hypothetical protein
MEGTVAAAMTHSLPTPSKPTLMPTTSICLLAPDALHPHGEVPVFEPYSNSNVKATFTIIGNLGTMCENWNQHEAKESRRLVEFERLQTGSAITATFRAIPQGGHSPNNACISCIYWARRGEYYVTSIDIITLLEDLLVVFFTAEAKDRILRNLKGFKAYAVSKNKGKCNDILQLIMGLPRPHGTNEDINIFPWVSLGQVLRKIIDKYVSDPDLARLGCV